MQLQRFPLIILAFAIGGCSAPNDAEMEQERTTSADAAIRSLPVDDWCKAEADRDIEAKMKLFTTDAVLMPPGKSDVIGQQAIRAWHEKMWQGTKYQCSGTIDEVQVFGDWGMVTGTFSGVFTPASGAPQRSSGRFLNTVERQADGNWKIARGIWNSKEGNIDWAPQIQRANEELLNKGNLELVEELFAPTYVFHGAEGDSEGGPDAIKAFLTSIRTAFPDLRVEVEILTTEGDKVAWQRTHRGTHQGEYLGVPASGRLITWRSMIVTRYEEGKIVEEWGVSDRAERLHAN